MPKIGLTLWDQVTARRMYDAMESFATIGRAVGASAGQISAFAGRHWPNRDKTGVIRMARGTVPAPSRKVRALEPGAMTLPPLKSLTDD